MEPLVFNFKAKIDEQGYFKRPTLTTNNVEGLFNETQLRMAYGKRKRRFGVVMPPKVMNINQLPDGVTVESSGFLTNFRIEI